MNLRELAESLGLSQTTVSRALNGYPEVREQTRARVLAAARAANYTPNTRARRLATGRAMTIGHVIPLSGRTEMVNPIFADFLAGAGEVYAREGYDMLLSVVGADGAEDAYRQMAANGSVDGVMVQGPQIDDPRIPLLQELGLPFIVHGRTNAASDYSWLDVANIRAFRRATEFLLDFGHRRIALINGQENFDFAARRRAGYEEAFAARGIATDPALPDRVGPAERRRVETILAQLLPISAKTEAIHNDGHRAATPSPTAWKTAPASTSPPSWRARSWRRSA
ncbi:MAG: LacI family transcriptional regulator [Rhodobacteraceae bacterium HLUCCO18]|nr:MAG: LacI family transcriptional regulator [Rhodobacteraceae bacterium HLUCCO18]